MQTVNVKFEGKERDDSYEILIGSDFLSSLPQKLNFQDYSQIAIVADQALAEQTWIKQFARSVESLGGKQSQLIYLKGAESKKNTEGLSFLWQEFLKSKLDRKSLAIAVGGGALLDLVGFAASTYMRGVDFIHVPTTLLSQVDASIGGKVGINFSEVKNLVGNFVQPKAVLIDVASLVSLPEREFRSGIAEILKHGFIQDKNYLDAVSGNVLTKNDNVRLANVIKRSCEIKASVVAQDEHETGLRKILNFGHTIGHALEVLSHKKSKPLLHGEAISLGMVVEAEISNICGLISKDAATFVKTAISNQGLPIKLEESYDWNEVLSKINQDKKNVASKIKWTLLKSLGEAIFDVEVDLERVQQAFTVI